MSPGTSSADLDWLFRGTQNALRTVKYFNTVSFWDNFCAVETFWFVTDKLVVFFLVEARLMSSWQSKNLSIQLSVRNLVLLLQKKKREKEREEESKRMRCLSDLSSSRVSKVLPWSLYIMCVNCGLFARVVKLLELDIKYGPQIYFLVMWKVIL